MRGKVPSPGTLNEREEAILQRLSAGRSDQQIADELLPPPAYHQVVQQPAVQEAGGQQQDSSGRVRERPRFARERHPDAASGPRIHSSHEDFPLYRAPP